MKCKLFILGLSLLTLSACEYNGLEVPSPAEGSVVLSGRLSNQRVNAFAEDKLGHIWMATQRGINRFDGNEFVQFFSTDDEQGLPDNQINAVLGMQDGRLCIATMNGVAFTTDKGNFHRVPVEDGNRNLSTILQTRTGRLILSNNTNLYCYIPDQDVIRPVIRELNAFGVPSMLLDRDDNLWVITGGGFTLNCYSTKDWQLLSSRQLPLQAFHIADARDGSLWFSGMGRLAILKISSGEWLPLPFSIRAEKRLMGGDVDILFPVDGNRMLMNVIGKGFFLYQKNPEKVIFQGDDDFPYSIPDAEVRTLFQDSRRNLWMGTMDKGFAISYYIKGLFGENKALVNAFKDKTVTSLCTDKDGNLWINTYMDGLCPTIWLLLLILKPLGKLVGVNGLT